VIGIAITIEGGQEFAYALFAAAAMSGMSGLIHNELRIGRRRMKGQPEADYADDWLGATRRRRGISHRMKNTL
jgi:hypothetical protein